MLETPFHETVGSRPAFAVRAAESTVLTCSACGCRLTARAGDATADSDKAWRHFPGRPGHDARGCRVACADLAHPTMSSRFLAG